MQLEYGPLNKTLHTQALELIGKTLVHNPELVNVYSKNNQLMADIGHQTFNVSSLLQKANLNHISLNDQDSKAYMPHAYERYGYGGHHSKYQALSSAEKSAIQSYTGSAYYSMNNLMYGKINHIHDSLSNTLVKTLFTSSGLNKITPEVTSNLSFRGEHSTPVSEIQHKISLAENGGGITQEHSFKSTSDDYHTAIAFSGVPGTIIVYKWLYGKDVSGLSHFPGESEFLLNASKVLWNGYTKINDTQIFEAEIVEPLDHERDTVDDITLESYRELFDFAVEQGLDIDFVTDHNLTMLEGCALNTQASLQPIDNPVFHEGLTIDTPEQNTTSLIFEAEPTPVNIADVIDDSHVVDDLFDNVVDTLTFAFDEFSLEYFEDTSFAPLDPGSLLALGDIAVESFGF